MNRYQGWAREIFVVGLGFCMSGFFGAACLLGQPAAPAGSGLVTAGVLAKLVDEGRKCHTVTEQEILDHVPRRPC